MAFAEEEHKKSLKIKEKVETKKKATKEPDWFNEKIEKKEISKDDEKKLQEMMEKYR